MREAIAAARPRPGDVELLAAVKYVPLEELGVARRGRAHAARREPRPGPRGQGDGAPGAFRWHFIGQLQSRKVKQILPHVELIHSVASRLRAAPARARTARPRPRSWSRSTSPARRARPGIAPDELRRFLERCPVPVVGLMTMPPFAEDPEASRPHFAALRELAAEHGLHQLSMGTSQDYAVAVEEGATIVRIGTDASYA